MTVVAALAGTGVVITGAEALVGAARSDGTVGIDRFTGPELIAQAEIARVSTDQAAIAQVSIVRGRQSPGRWSPGEPQTIEVPSFWHRPP